MPRQLSTETIDALNNDKIFRIVWLCKLEFNSTTLYLTSSKNTFNWDSQSWLGNGQFLGFSQVTESNESITNGITIKLDGTDPTLRSLVLAQSRQNKLGIIWMGLLDTSLNLIQSPIQIYRGKFDFANLTDTGQESIIELQYENEGIERKRVNARRYTAFSQKSLFSGDEGFQYTSRVEDWSGFWGKAARVKFIKKAVLKKKS